MFRKPLFALFAHLGLKSLFFISPPPVLCEVPVFTRPLTGSPVNFPDCLIGSPISSQSTGRTYGLLRDHAEVEDHPVAAEPVQALRVRPAAAFATARVGSRVANPEPTDARAPEHWPSQTSRAAAGSAVRSARFTRPLIGSPIIFAD